VTCFTPGTKIATPRGARAVEELKPGDCVITRDNGTRKIVWVGTRTLDFASLGRAPHLGPIRLSEGSLGGGLPLNDLVIAPNERVLVLSDRSLISFEDHEALVAAKHLVNSRSIRRATMLGVTYVHVMCERHQVVLANGCWCELFQPADHALNGLGNAQRNELAELFPELSAQTLKNGFAQTGWKQ